MIVSLARKGKIVAWFMIVLFYCDLVFATGARAGYVAASITAPWKVAISNNLWLPVPEKKDHPIAERSRPAHTFTTGPGQPEMQQFSSVNASNMVDLFSGDFSYNIPLMDVGGYPVNLSYRGGITMDQEASWVGLGWNINPGTVTRNLRGLPDDFNGANDSIKKIMSIKENKTIGVTLGGDVEIVGLRKTDQGGDNAVATGIKLGASIGVLHNNYKGWGIEYGLNVSINSGRGAKGPLSGGLSITNSSQEGLTVAPSLSVKLSQNEGEEKSGDVSGSLSISAPYNSRSGLKALQLSTGISQFSKDEKNQKQGYNSSSFSSFISFAGPTYTPSITIPFTSNQYSFTARAGIELKVTSGSAFINGYVSRQFIDKRDTLLALPSYGYLHYQDGALNRGALLDFNREKELPYREKPAMPHIAIPEYTYDAFSITGEGTGGMFRAYRGDIGFVYDHYIRTRDASDRLSLDLGSFDLLHSGVDLNINRAFTQNGPWLNQNTMRQVIDFRKDSADFEAVYFRNPGEKSINSKLFYDSVGGDDVVTVGLAQSDRSSPFIHTTNFLTKYRNKRAIGTTILNRHNAVKPERDKRSQVISYLTAREADAAGLTKYIENYTVNLFNPAICGDASFDIVDGTGTGLIAQYFKGIVHKGNPYTRPEPKIDTNWAKGAPKIPGDPSFPADKFSIRWIGRVKAPVTGTYTFFGRSDDGYRLWLNDSLKIDHNDDHPVSASDKDSIHVNLVAGQLYSVRVEYYENKSKAEVGLSWSYPGQAKQFIPMTSLYPPPAKDTFQVNSYVSKEQRVNKFRKPNHISEMTVLNNDGRRYVYGIPVYNLKQREATFAVDGFSRGNAANGLVKYTPGTDNSSSNPNGKDNYYNSEEVPAYAHSFLLTGILSADYSDITGNGISDDDIGDAVKFNYSKICGIANPYKWRAPAQEDSATFNQGLKTDNRDDKGNYVYGEKELWYLHSIESKTMIATFTLEGRDDLPAIDERGYKINNGATRRLKEINLFSKADFAAKGTSAKAIKTVHFEYSYELCKGVNKPLNDTGKLTLKKVWFTYNGNNKGKLNPYNFSYNSKNPGYNIKSYDRWGNFKDPLQNPGSTTGNVINNAEYPYTLQDSAAAAGNAPSWTLDSIKLPSGGSIKVQYEEDDYAFVQNKRAMQLFKIAGLSNVNTLAGDVTHLYTRETILVPLPSVKYTDNKYVFIKVPRPVHNTKEIYRYYLAGADKLYFRMSVKMPTDSYGSGNEYVPCYAELENASSYGLVDSTTIWIKISGIDNEGNPTTGGNSPLVKAALQFLKLNLPSKAYPGSETGDNVTAGEAVKILASTFDNIKDAINGFDKRTRDRGWVSSFDPGRSYVRLNNPYYKKYGGGHRVKRVVIYDNWDKMTNQRAAIYGQEYTYTTTKEINGVQTTISSGVASYEPGIGGDENPFHVPIEYVEKIAPLGPVTLGYSEEPLGESFFPSPGVGYSKVRVRTINYQKKKSANGYDETTFYTAYDFPTYTDRSLIDNDTKKRYKPTLANFLRVNAKHYLSLSQGFKIELNDMHGKLRSKASYAETDPAHPISYSENIYKVENPDIEFKRLSNTVTVMKPDGSIDTAALIGKDVELMVDMREQLSVTNGYNVNLNTEMFTIPFPTPPFFLIPSFLNLAQREENIFRSVATMKVIQRYGILDSAIQVDKGSKISTKDILYDSETGDVLLTRTQNEFNDYVYNFTYPSHWAYDGMGLAYKNIDVTLHHINFLDGVITGGLNVPDSTLFSSGDEILVSGKQLTTEIAGCLDSFATFPVYNKLWAVDSSVQHGGKKSFYFIDRSGKPYSGHDITLKIIRSGRRNMFSAVGSVTSLENPIKKNVMSGNYELVMNTATKTVAAGAAEYKQLWKVEDIKRRGSSVNCVSFMPEDCGGHISCICTCLRKIFDTLIAKRRLFIRESDHITVDSIAHLAGISTSACDLLQSNSGKNFHAITTDSVSHIYKAKVGDCIVSLTSIDSATALNFYQLKAEFALCDTPIVRYTSPVITTPDTTGRVFPSTESVVALTYQGFKLPFYAKDTSAIWLTGYNGSDAIGVAYHIGVDTYHPYNIRSYVNFVGITDIPVGSTIVSATLNLNNYPGGFLDSASTAHSINDSFVVFTPNFAWDKTTNASDFMLTSLEDTIVKTTSGFQNFSLDVKRLVQAWVNPSSPQHHTGFGLKPYYYHTNDTSFFTFYSSNYSELADRPNLVVYYSEPDTSYVVSSILRVESCMSCDTIADSSCRSIVIDTTLNPYVTGILGNFRNCKSYTYYSGRTETDPAAQTDIRRNGTFASFDPFWSFDDSALKPLPDTNRWVWNSEMTLFNRKGFEIENKDPLGRYNAGQYGYNLTMPVAVTQNSRNRESAFEGFEDYGFVTQVCDTACSAKRHIDFSGYKSKIDTTQKHTGKASLRLGASEQAGLSFSVIAAAQDTIIPALSFIMKRDTCAPGDTVLRKISADNKVLLPTFAPIPGKHMVLSVWVREDVDCKCVSYANNRVVILFPGIDTMQFTPTGNIIEGWQRYESIFDIPGGATTMIVSLEATSSTTVFFDDLRIHPFNANMKSFVFHPVNLRLMAELDENNYATLYEYDDDGTLIRLKKETERGIKTIKETRSALVKDNL